MTNWTSYRFNAERAIARCVNCKDWEPGQAPGYCGRCGWARALLTAIDELAALRQSAQTPAWQPALRELTALVDEMRRSLGPSWPPNFSSGLQVDRWQQRINRVVHDVSSSPLSVASEPGAASEQPDHGYDRGRLAVMRELTAAVARFNDDESMGIGQLIDVIQPWLDPDAPSASSPAHPMCSRCGGPHPFDTSVPSAVWNRVIRANGLPDYLCLTCIVEAFVSRRESFTASLVGGDFCGPMDIAIEVGGKAATDAAAIQEENNALRWKIRELEAAASSPAAPLTPPGQKPCPTCEGFGTVRDRTQPAYPGAPTPGGETPRRICLCGSTRFIEVFATATWVLERQGYIVLGCTLLPSWFCGVPNHFGEATGTKAQCDDLHLRKIDLADEVLVLDVGGYIGESTRAEIVYATSHGKPIKYLSADADLQVIIVQPLASPPVPTEKEQP